jgi:hypothetical protein
MNKFIIILVLASILGGFSSCTNTNIKKPDQLIAKDKFIKMMVDIYLSQGIPVGTPEAKSLKKVTQNDLYYSVLKKYNMPDTVFIRSLIYYSSFPKEYEKIQTQIMNILNEAELQYKPKDKLNVGTE